MNALPIDPLLPELVASLRQPPNLVLEAEPGAGKTTRVPRALLDAGLLEAGECWVLEPRRIAARLAAKRVAEELGEELGRTVGYQVRFEQKRSKDTRICFVTEGLLLRRLQGDPELRGISAVVLDEFHERHLHTDLALTLLRRLQAGTRPDLRILVMSATLDADPVAAFLEAPRFQSAGRQFPVSVEHQPRPDDRPVPVKVAEALERLYGGGQKGHTLVFLPGGAEIRACQRECERAAERFGLRLLPLHGDLGAEAQEEAIRPSDRPKVILSTNLAESSVTFEGIEAVVDSGLGREAVHSPWSGLTTLRTARISRARCVQRAGRAGRTGPGRCLRLYTEADFQARPAFDEPELHRADLAELALTLHALGLREPGRLAWFEAPPEAHLDAAERLLRRLGAVDAAGGLAALGRRLLAFPLHPRLGRLLAAGEELGIPDLAARAAALLESGDLHRQPPPGAPLDSDLLPRLDAFHEAEADRFSPGALRAAGLDAGAVHRAKLAHQNLRRLVKEVPEPADAETRLRRALLLAFPDRVARRGAGSTLTLCEGGGAVLDPGSRVQKADLVVALEAQQLSEGGGTRVRVRAASAVDPEWVLESFPDAVRDVSELRFNPASERVEAYGALMYGDAALDEDRRAADPSDPRTAEALAQAFLARPLPEAFTDLLDRLAFLQARRPDLELPDREALAARLAAKGCEGFNRLKDLEGADWGWAAAEAFGPAAARLLETWAPAHVQLPKRRARVHYGGETPWVESRLQDFLGLKEGPRIAGGQVPLLLHLLAPNHRAVQVTTDLAGFWHRVYQELRPQLSRRYPRHLWPEKPWEMVEE